MDEAEQTTSDYAVTVRNPPTDARDPNEWKTYFEQFGHVTTITIALSNKGLLTKLMERRTMIDQLQDLLPNDIVVDAQNLDPLSKEHEAMFEEAKHTVWPWYLRWMGLVTSLDSATIRQRLVEIHEQIETDLSQRNYDVSEVLVVFEQEASQQKCLQELQTPLVNVYFNRTSGLAKPEHAFRGNKVLRVVEPPEPSSVRTPQCRFRTDHPETVPF